MYILHRRASEGEGTGGDTRVKVMLRVKVKLRVKLRVNVKVKLCW